MLDFMRKHANSWFVSVIIGAIVVVFVLWGIGTMRSAQFQKVAEVDGTKIYLTDYQRAYQNLIRTYQERLGSDFNEEAAKAMNLKAQVLNKLVDEVLVRQTAGRLGLVVTDAELRHEIAKIPAFCDERGFNENRYHQLLARQHIPASDFEDQERQVLLFQKVVGFITSFAKVSDADLQETYRLENEAVKVNYFIVGPSAFLKEQQAAPAEVDDFYKKHTELFREPEKIQVRYGLLKFGDFDSKIKSDPEKIENFYYDHLDEFSESQAVRLQEISLAVPPDASATDRERLRQVADDILKNARAGIPFDQLVKKYSLLPGLQIKGNDLGVVKRGQKPADWEAVVFKLKKGESGLVVASDGFQVLQAIEIIENKAPAFAGIKPQVEKVWRAAEVRRLAKQQAEALRDESQKSPLAEVLKQHQVAVQETPLLAVKDPIPGLGIQPAVTKVVQELKPQEVSKPIALPDGVVLLQVINRQESVLPPLTQIRDKVADAVRQNKAREAAAQESKKMLERLRQGENLAKVAASRGLKVEETDFFTRPQGFPGHPQAKNLSSAAFILTEKSPYPTEPVSVGGENIILGFKERRQPNPDQFARDKDEMLKTMLDIKRQIVFSQWLTELRQHANIKVYEMPS